MIDRMWRDVDDFHVKFHFPRMAAPTPLHRLPARAGLERLRHLTEELHELTLAVNVGDVAAQADALADIVYVALGTARMMGLPWAKVWAAVHAANMSKVSGDSAKRVAKPAGWVDPLVEIELTIARAREKAAKNLGFSIRYGREGKAGAA